MLRWGGQRSMNLENLTFDQLVTQWTHGWMTQPRQVGYTTPKTPVCLEEIMLRPVKGALTLRSSQNLAV